MASVEPVFVAKMEINRLMILKIVFFGRNLGDKGFGARQGWGMG